MPAISPQLFWPYFTAVAITLLAIIVPARYLPYGRHRRILLSLGPLCIAIPMAVFGADHLSDAKDVMQIVPAWISGRLFWTYFVGVCLIAAALSIVLKIQVRLSSMLLGSMLLAFVLLIHIPNAMVKPGDRFRWIYAARDLSFACGAFTLGIIESPKGKVGENCVVTMQFLIAAIAIFFGVEHLLHLDHVPGVPLEMLMPAWIPFARLWTSLTGVAFILGGLAMLVARSRQIAAEALGILVLLLTFLIYVPMMIAKPDLDSLNYVTDTMVFAGTLLVMGSAAASHIRGARDTISLPMLYSNPEPANQRRGASTR